MTSIKVKNNNCDKVLSELDERVKLALEAIGMKCEDYAKEKCPTDTGLLKNSITHAVGGQTPAITMYHAEHSKNGKQGIGFYTEPAPDEKAVFVGSNVEYAPYVEYGTVRTDARPFLKPAVQDHTDEYRRLAEDVLKNEL